MAKGLQSVVTLTAVAVCAAACSSGGSDTTLAWTAFEPTDCPAGSDAASCYVLRAEVDGRGGVEGRCDVVALGTDGSNLFTATTFGPLELAPDSTFEWTVELPEVDDPDFDGWEPECFPPVEG